MADYSAFDHGIVPWLQTVWTKRRAIEQGVRTTGRDEGAWLVYDCYNDPLEDKRETEAWTLFREDAKNSTLESLKQTCAGNFNGTVPPGVKQVISGLGWSKEPTAAEHGSPAVNEVYGNDRHSFGSFLAGVICMALEQSWSKTENDYVKELPEFFLNVGIDPANPHVLRSISWEELKHLAGVGNGNIVRTDGAKPTTVFKDQTNVFPI